VDPVDRGRRKRSGVRFGADARDPTLTPPDDEPTPVTDISELVDELYDELRATEELPVDRTAGRWIGEAQAVAADVAEGDPPESVVHERVGHVRRLLSEVDDAGDAAATERVERASELAEEILDRVEE